ncbi:hypothetical protein D9758_010759 [Tetrapyrgos nigripes]|uniref:Uncharacterized protein n=1 Tax=Tetrapyrgos nigripes TaxID=182062 RepID=A0A8H5FYG9_9AGAR|nr:hypothetical protein D9758_010759 [Tetrapyrgos nigripes]
MHLIASCRPAPSTLEDKPLIICQRGEKRKFLRREEDYNDMIRVVRRKFDIPEHQRPILETRSFDVCRGRNIEVDEDVYSIMISSLEEIEVVTLDSPVAADTVGAPHAESSATGTGHASSSRMTANGYGNQASDETNPTRRDKGKGRESEAERVDSNMNVGSGTSGQSRQSQGSSSASMTSPQSNDDILASLERIDNIGASQDLEDEPMTVTSSMHQGTTSSVWPPFDLRNPPLASLARSAPVGDEGSGTLLSDAQEAPALPSNLQDDEWEHVQVEQSGEPTSYHEHEENRNATAGPSNSQIPVHDDENSLGIKFNEKGYTDDGRLQIFIAGPTGETKLFILKQKHRTGELITNHTLSLIHVSSSRFLLHSSYLELLIQFEDDEATVQYYATCNKEDTVGQSGIRPLARLRLRVYGDGLENNETGVTAL